MAMPRVGEMWLEPHSNVYYLILETYNGSVTFTYLNKSYAGTKDKVNVAHFDLFCRKVD
jgi:hypothetical protein